MGGELRSGVGPGVAVDQNNSLDLQETGTLHCHSCARLPWLWLRLVLASAIALWPLPARAQAPRLGVVRSRDNNHQWSEITTRLQQTNVDYCWIDWTTAREPRRLESSQLSVLLLPNVESIDNSQAAILQAWLGSGGRAVVTGSTGSLSPPPVRAQLRSLLGAYWGFPLSSPTAVRATGRANLSGAAPTTPVRGGAIIPTGAASQAIAVWQTDGEPPAVVANEQVTFFGWRWGSDAASSANLDAAWLRAALNRYGAIAPYRPGSGAACDGSAAAPTPNPVPQALPAAPPATTSPAASPPRPRPATALVDDPQADTDAAEEALDSILERDGSPPPRPTEPSGRPLSPQQVQALNAQLEDLIGRYESAILMGQASNGGPELSLARAIAQAENDRQKRQVPTLAAIDPTATQARQHLGNFRRLAGQQAFGQAWQEWTQARTLIWENYPTTTVLRHPETRAMWFDRGTIVRTRSEAELARIFNRLQDAGINTVFFETLNASYPIYPSQVAPEQNPFTQGWDPLAAAVKLAQERNMELHAWIWVFAAANQRHNQILRQPRDYLGPVLARNPDWVATNRQGNPFQGSVAKAFFDPAHPEVQAYLLALIDEIATNYNVDGIHLDYIRYPFQDPRVDQVYGFGTASRTQFRRLTGVDPITLRPSDPLWSRWTQFRIQQVDTFVASTAALLRQKHPQVRLSAAVFPIPASERLARLQQNWEGWIAAGHIDLLVPMTYASDTPNLQRLTQPLFSRGLENSALFLPGIRLLGLPTTVALDQMQYLRDSPASGYALFAAENLSLNLQTILRRVQGDQQGRLPLAHRQPLAAAREKYSLLTREWAIALTHDQLVLSAADLRDFGRQTAALEAAFTTLAAQPSAANLRRTQSLLTTLRRQFPRWLSQHAAQRPYQTEAWFNRLAAVDKLLRYGERVELGQSRR